MTDLETREFNGLRVLVVEDDFLVATALKRDLAELGCDVIGPTSTSEEACTLLKKERVEAAVLDINLTPGTSAPVARALSYQNCPFVFITGYSDVKMLPEDLRGCLVLSKPVDRYALSNVLRGMRHPTTA